MVDDIVFLAHPPKIHQGADVRIGTGKGSLCAYGKVDFNPQFRPLLSTKKMAFLECQVFSSPFRKYCGRTISRQSAKAHGAVVMRHVDALV